MLSAAGEAAGLGDCAEVAKLVEFHGVVLRNNWPASEGGPYKYATAPIELKLDTAIESRESRIGYAYPLYPK
jgi:hypothetical protein